MFGRKIVFVVNNSTYFVSHRMTIGLRLLEMGCEVHVVAPGSCPADLSSHGFQYHRVNISRNGKNPLEEIKTIHALYAVFTRLKPDLVHLVTIKPYLYGGIAARLANVPAVVSAVAGLGILFSQNTYSSRLLRLFLNPFYRFAFGHSNQTVIFQNKDDRAILQRFALLPERKIVLIRGAGVSLEKYSYRPEPEGVPVVSLASRLLKDKGVLEFVEASRVLQQRGVKAQFWLIGTPDPGNANTVTQGQLDEWEKNGLVQCLGYRADIAELFAKSHIITLPSCYGEGLPKVLIEAAACGRAVVTTDHPGCRDAIEADVTGLLIPIKDSTALADAIETLINNEKHRQQLGRAGRELAEEFFDVEKVVDAHIRVYSQLL